MKNKNKKEISGEEVSKMAIDEKNLKVSTIPNPVVVGGIEAIGLKRIPPIEIPKYLLMHPALPRGIEIKANRMIKLVDGELDNNIFENSTKVIKKDLFKGKDRDNLVKEASIYCNKILYNSGGPLFLKQLAQGAYRFGTSFAVLQTNIAMNEVLRFEYQHEIFFGPARYPKELKKQGVDWGEIPMVDRRYLAGKMKINPKTKRIAKYTQLTRKYPEIHEDNFNFYASTYINTKTTPGMKNKSPGELVPVGLELDESEVIQLAFDTIGDEPLGLSLVQFLQLTLNYLITMEKAGAQTMVNFGFNKWVASTPFKNDIKMKEFAKSLANLQKDSIIVLPKEIELKNIEPGTTEFDKIHPIYMRLIAIRLGIPMPLLVQDGTSTNKATLSAQREDMYDDFIADELTIERTINEGFFKACKVKWDDLTIEELDYIVPKFKFNQPPEDKDKEQDRDLKHSLTVRNFATAAREWAEASYDSVVIDNIGAKINQLIQKSLPDEELKTGKKEEMKKTVKEGMKEKEDKDDGEHTSEES